MRKTLPVTEIIDSANFILATSKGESGAALRAGVVSFAGQLIMKANAYVGFRYLSTEDVPEGEKPGIIFDESDRRAHQYPDTTRIAYYTDPKLSR